MQTSWGTQLFAARADGTAVASTATEATLLAGIGAQPTLYAGFFDQGNRAFGKRIHLHAAGVFSTTGTPTMIFQVRSSTTQGNTQYGGTSLGVSAAITTQSGVTNKWWELDLYMVCYTPGQGTGNTTLTCNGSVKSPTGFASPFLYPLEVTTPDTATWTATIDNSLTQFLNLSMTWSASSASNTVTLKDIALLEYN